ncbi:hypothetical protein ACHAXT_002948 [Thalassiosira profunda]
MASSADAKPKPWAPTSSNFTPRYAGPSPESMTPVQLALRRSILASRPGTGLSGPFGPWLAVPEIAAPSQELGRTVRYDTSLSRRESELVILLTGAKFQSEAEFDIHVGEAWRAGIGWDVIHSIPRGALLPELEAGGASEENAPVFSVREVERALLPALAREHGEGQVEATPNGQFSAKEREIAIVRFAAELLERNAVRDETYAAAKEVLGGRDSVLVEITAIIGYYAYVAYTLNVFRIPSSAEPPT